MLGAVPVAVALPSWASVALPAAAALLAVAVAFALLRRRRRRRHSAGTTGDVGGAAVVGLLGRLPHWDAVAGLDEVKAELREIVDLMQQPERFTRLGARAPRGLLLHGAPGTGKTLLAQALAAEAGVPLLTRRAMALAGGPADGAAQVEALFAAARAAAPALLLIDDLDAPGLAHGGDVLGQLVAELDALDPDCGVVVIGAAAKLAGVDPALLRRGRFDRQLHLAPPDLAGREAILRVHLREKPLSADVDLAAIARHSAGLTGADLASAANEAALLAGRQELQRIRHVDLEAALERVVVGLPQRRRVSEREKRILAFHEAGHALVAHALGIGPLQKVTIVGAGPALGAVIGLPGDDRQLRTRDELVDLLVVMLAGRAAEQVAFGRVTDGAADDLERATALARAMVFEYGMGDATLSRTMRADNYALSEETKRLRDASQARLTDGAYESALALLLEHRPLLDRLAGQLLLKETLDRHELADLLAEREEPLEQALALGVLRSLPRRD